MKILVVFLVLVSFAAHSQLVFSHNDYAQARPFEGAYGVNAAYIESDVFFENETLLVAHAKEEIDPARTLRNLYLDPIRKKIQENNGKVYSDGSPLTLMIDIKGDATPTLKAIVHTLNSYPDLTSCSTLTIAISGNYPAPAEWRHYPEFIHFDGRPATEYTAEQLKRVHLISIGFPSLSAWRGVGAIPPADLEKIRSVTSQAEHLGKPFRFWAIPDTPRCWKLLFDAGVDIINTDHPDLAMKMIGNPSEWDKLH